MTGVFLVAMRDQLCMRSLLLPFASCPAECAIETSFLSYTRDRWWEDAIWERGDKRMQAFMWGIVREDCVNLLLDFLQTVSRVMEIAQMFS